MNENKNDNLKKYQELISEAARIRKDKGKTLQSIADSMGVAQPNIARLESMNHEAKVSTLLAYLDTLDCTLEIVPKKKAKTKNANTKAETFDSFDKMSAKQFIRVVMYAKELIDRGGLEIVPDDTET